MFWDPFAVAWRLLGKTPQAHEIADVSIDRLDDHGTEHIGFEFP